MATPTKRKYMRVALYTRVSTHDQQTLPMQCDTLREYTKRRGWEVVREVSEIGSGAVKRPQREELIKAAKRREVDAVLVWRLDRWGRSVADLVNSLAELEAVGVAFVSVTEALDLTTPAERAMAAMVAVFAQFEREILRERVKAGIAQAKAKGSSREDRKLLPNASRRYKHCTRRESVRLRLPSSSVSVEPPCVGF